MNFCTSESCKIVILLFVTFIAGYLILTNSRYKLQEYFEEEATNSTSAQANIINPNDPVDQQIRALYQKVYFEEIPPEELARYTAELNQDNFDADSFCRNLTIERTSAVQDMINEVFMKVLKRPATPDEMDKYLDLYMSGQLTSPNDLVRILSNSPELAVDTAPLPQQELKRDDYNLYKQIIDTYQKVLDRLPNAGELNHYFVMMKKDANFTLDKLQDALLTSREYGILSMNQRNVVQGELMGNITERQLQIVITNLYQSVYQTPPDKSTYNYLRGKFIDFSLDDEKLVIFIKQLKSAETSTQNSSTSGSVQAVTQSTNGTVPQSTIDTTSTSPSGINPISSTTTTTTTSSQSVEQNKTNAQINDAVIEQFMNYKPDMNSFFFDKPERYVDAPFKSTITVSSTNPAIDTTTTDDPINSAVNANTAPGNNPDTNTSTSNGTSTANGSTTPQGSTITYNAINDPNENKSVNVYDTKCCDALANSMLNKTGYPDSETTERVIQSIKDGAKCGFDKNRLEKVLELNDQQLYADYVNGRNNDLNSSCAPGKSIYTNANNNMVLYPEFKWSVPQKRPPVCYTKGNHYQPLIDQTALIGTLLCDAKCTQTGSILPDFKYEEKPRLP
jgi:hypothetical protein